MIELKQVCHTYENALHPALEEVSFSIEQGEMLAVVGHNGSGKSTLAKHLNGLLLPNSGHVLVDGMDTQDEKLLLNIRQKVGMVFQNPDNQLVTTVVEEDVAFGPEGLGLSPEEIRRRVDAALAAVHMEAFAARSPHMLSGGQKQRIAIAGMLAMEPEVLVLDEATSMLDPQGRRDILEIVKRLNAEKGMTVVLITQLMEEAVLCGRVAVMARGKIVALDTPRNVFRNAPELRKAGLDAPAMVRLRDALALEGIPLSGEPITLNEMADAIAARYQAAHG